MKKQIAYVLIGLIALAGVYYFLKGDKLGSSSLIPKSPFDTDDEIAYNQIRNLFPKDAMEAWVDAHIKERYDTNPTFLAGNKSKAATALDVLGAVAPNVNGSHPATPWSGGKPLLWSDSLFVQAWGIRNALQSKYSTL